MPTYEYECPKCGNTWEEVLPLSRYQEPQNCPNCGGVGNKLVSSPGLIFQGDGWATKNNRIAGQMRKKTEAAASRQEERRRDGPGVRLVPNVDGERTESWSDARKLAASQGKDTSSYDAKVVSERAVKAR